MTKIIMLVICVFLLGCIPTSEEIRGHNEQKRKDFDLSCTVKLKLLYPSKKIQRGNWVRVHEWHQRLYLVDGKVFQCRQTDYFNERVVDVTPVKFGAKR